MFHSSSIFHLFHPRRSNCVLVEFLPWKAILWCKRPNLRKHCSIKGCVLQKDNWVYFPYNTTRGPEMAFSSLTLIPTSKSMGSVYYDSPRMLKFDMIDCAECSIAYNDLNWTCFFPTMVIRGKSEMHKDSLITTSAQILKIKAVDIAFLSSNEKFNQLSFQKNM